MSSTILLIVLLCAHITGLISVKLSATVGGSVLIPCSLPGYPLSLTWFYWQEGDNLFFRWENGEEIKVKDNKYEGRFQVITREFRSGNISITLDNISPEDDQKIFFAYVNLYDEQKKVAKPSEERCRSTLQVSAPYQHLVLMVNHTTNSATCSARGGYPAAQVSWKGQNRTSDTELDLQGAEPPPQQDPTEKTFSFMSSVNITGLKSVTCIVYNPHSHETLNRTVEIEGAAGENERSHVAAIVVAVVLVILIIAVAVLFCLWYKSQHQDPLNAPPVELNPQDGAQEEDLAADQAPPNPPPVELNPQDGAQTEDSDAAEPAEDPVQEEAADASEEAVLLSQNQAVFRRRLRSKSSASRDTDEDAADSPEKENLFGNRTSVSENLDQN